MDPLDNEVVWDTLYKNTFWGQNGGPVVFAGISAIDFALWDIRGKFFNVPVYKLLGGKKQDNLRKPAPVRLERPLGGSQGYGGIRGKCQKSGGGRIRRH